jgi:hypothetical protein
MEEREVRSSQGEMISESPAHVRTMGSDSLHALAPHGHGGSVTPTALRAASRQALKSKRISIFSSPISMPIAPSHFTAERNTSTSALIPLT